MIDLGSFHLPILLHSVCSTQASSLHGFKIAATAPCITDRHGNVHQQKRDSFPKGSFKERSKRFLEAPQVSSHISLSRSLSYDTFKSVLGKGCGIIRLDHWSQTRYVSESPVGLVKTQISWLHPYSC